MALPSQQPLAEAYAVGACGPSFLVAQSSVLAQGYHDGFLYFWPAFYPVHIVLVDPTNKA